MIKSMTGFGKADCELCNHKVIAEIKSLNSKQADVSVRIPAFYREKEHEIRTLLVNRLERGKIDFALYLEDRSQMAVSNLNVAAVEAHLKALRPIAEANGQDTSRLLQIAMRMPDVISTETQTVSDEDWARLQVMIGKVIDLVDEFRLHEGDILAKDMCMRIEKIQSLMTQIEPFEVNRTEQVKSRLKKQLESLLSADQVDKNRFEQELIYYLEKLDITEEKVRLKKHCQYFLDCVNDHGAGKKLGFVAQEIGREINTIGSKANDVDIQKIVVQMKDELEKIKEQLGNIL